jgi:hypothetical protein
VDATAACGAFIRELERRLANAGAAGLAAKTGLHESIVREMTEGNSQDLFSWEMVSTCVTAADVPQEAVVRLRELWVLAEAAQWAERGPELLREIERQAEQARRQRPYHEKALSRRLFSEYRPSAPWRKTSSSGYPHGRWRFESWSSAQLLINQGIPDPDRAMSLSEFYTLLRQLHLWAGRPSYTEIEQRSWGSLSRTTAGTVLGEARALYRRVRDHDNVRYLATVFGLPGTEAERWVTAYTRVREQSPKTQGLLSFAPAQAVPAVKTTARLRRWRTTALCFAASTAALGLVIALMVAAGNPPEAQNLQFPNKPRLFPGKPVRISLRVPAGDWSLALHFRLESTEVASACVNDAQLSYVVEKPDGRNLAAGRTTRGKSDSWLPAVRLGRRGAPDSPQVAVSVSVPNYDAGCGFTIDLSGSIIRPR